MIIHMADNTQELGKEFTLYALVATKDGGSQEFDNVKYRLHYKLDVSSFEDTAVLHIDEYENIFNKGRNSANAMLKRLSVVKITCMDDNGQTWSVYRKFRPCYDKQCRGKIAVTYHTLLFLTDVDGSVLGKKVFVKKGSRLMYYLKHPNEIVQISFVLAIMSVILGAMALVLTLVLQRGC